MIITLELAFSSNVAPSRSTTASTSQRRDVGRRRSTNARNEMTNDDTPVHRMGEGPYALNDDDTAVDPRAFRDALRNDAAKMKDIERDDALAKALLGDDTGAMQEALKKIMALVRERRAIAREKETSGRSRSATGGARAKDATIDGGANRLTARFRFRHAIKRSNRRTTTCTRMI